MQIALLSLNITDVFQMWSLLRRTYYLNEQDTKYVSIYVNDDLRPQVKTATCSGHAVLNDTQWFILVTFKSEIPKNEVHELGESRHTLSMYCGRYIRITSENTRVHLSKKGRSQLTHLASACIDRQVIKVMRLQDELVERRDKCVESKSFCTTQLQLPLISKLCMMNLVTEQVFSTSLIPTVTKCLLCISVEVKWILQFVHQLTIKLYF
jgi:hypothetical protein